MCEVLENVDPDDTKPIDTDKAAYDKEAVSNVWAMAMVIAKANSKWSFLQMRHRLRLGYSQRFNWSYIL